MSTEPTVGSALLDCLLKLEDVCSPTPLILTEDVLIILAQALLQPLHITRDVSANHGSRR